jgi:hypothetical protein
MEDLALPSANTRGSLPVRIAELLQNLSGFSWAIPKYGSNAINSLNLHTTAGIRSKLWLAMPGDVRAEEILTPAGRSKRSLAARCPCASRISV